MYDGLIYIVARMDIREQQDIGVPLNLTVCGALVLCRLGINGQVQGKGAVHNAAGDLARLAHTGQFRGVHSDGHLGIHHLHRRQRSHLGAGDSAGSGHGYCIVDNIYFVLQSRIGDKSHIRQEQKLVDTRHFENGHMRQRIAGAQTYFLIQYALQEILGIYQALHIHVYHAFMGQLHCLQRRLGHIRLINNLKALQVHVHLCGNGADLGLIAHQNGVRNTPLFCLPDCVQHRLVLSRRHGHLLHTALVYLFDNIIESHVRFLSCGPYAWGEASLQSPSDRNPISFFLSLRRAVTLPKPLSLK